MRNTTKFSSPKLYIYNSTYDFSKFAYISNLQPLTAGAHELARPTVISTKQSIGADRPEFVDSELFDDGTNTTRFPMSFHTHWGSKLG